MKLQTEPLTLDSQVLKATLEAKRDSEIQEYCEQRAVSTVCAFLICIGPVYTDGNTCIKDNTI